MGIIRDSFVMFKNWSEAIDALPEEYQLETYKALSKYGLTGEMPSDISPIAKAILTSFSKGMENNIARYNASVENGKKGGRHTKKDRTEESQQVNCKNNNLDKPNLTQDNLHEPTPNLNVNDNVNVNDCVNDNLSKRKKEKSTALGGSEPSAKDFLTDAEVIDYIKTELKDKMVCERFIAYANNRRGMGKKYAIRTKTTVDLCIKDLRKWATTQEEAIEILDYSIKNNYPGLFRPKENQPDGHKESPIEQMSRVLGG